VPLMEPDLLGDFQGVFVPSIGCLGMGVDARRLPAVTSNDSTGMHAGDGEIGATSNDSREGGGVGF
jgi:hypothetical protein